MSQLIGWITHEEAHKCPEGLFLSRGRFVCRVMSKTASDAGRDRLSLTQACFRAYAAFLPAGSEPHDEDSRQLLYRIARLGRFGQLHVRIERRSDETMVGKETGTAYLRSLKARRAERVTWFTEAETLIHRIARTFDAGGMLARRGKSVLVCDLLLPKEVETTLLGRLQPLIREENASRAANVTVSGLWAPMSFVDIGDT